MQNKKINLPKGYQLLTGNSPVTLLTYGSVGTVHLVKCTKSGETVAIKKLNFKPSPQQLQFLLQISHQNIIKLLDHHQEQKSPTCHLILEYTENGTLANFIQDKDHNPEHAGLKDRRLLNGIFHSVCDAVEYLHSHGLFCRDFRVWYFFIQPQNIMMDRRNVAKLVDFGFVDHHEQKASMADMGKYMAPEVLMRDPCTYKADIWALGILYYELIEGKTPFEGLTHHQIIEHAQKPITFSNKFRQNEITLINSILKLEPTQRPEIKDITSSLCLKIHLSSSLENSKRSTSDESSIVTHHQHHEPKIKLMEIKELIDSPTKKRCSGIQILSIKELNQCEESILESKPVSPLYATKIEKPHFFLSQSKEKISLKKVSKKHH